MSIKGKTCAIVGWSDKILGQGLGSEIDACDYVVRVNLHHTKETDATAKRFKNINKEWFYNKHHSEADYGSRTDYVFLCCKIWRSQPILNDIYSPGLKIMCKTTRRYRPIKTVVPVTFIPVSYHHEFKAAGVGHPYTGTIAIYCLLRWGAVVKTYGMDLFLGMDLPKPNPHIKRHDRRKDARFLKTFLTHPRFRPSEDLKKAIALYS